MGPHAPEIPPHKLISTLRGFNLLPAIVFLPTRRKCDEAALETAADRSQPSDVERRSIREAIFDEFLVENPEIRSHKHRKILVNAGIASHHAGHIPAWKLLIEKMMSSGLLNAIFATSTVAAGVDFPARTVVLSNADTRGNDGWRPLTASELQQMTGRAGRRGKDNVGFAVLAPGPFQNPRKIAELLQAKPDPLESRFRSTYTTLLNLLDAFGDFDQVREIVEKSFAFRDTRRQITKLERDMEGRIDSLRSSLTESGTGVTLSDIRGFERLVSALTRLEGSEPGNRAEKLAVWLRENVKTGRIVTKGRSGKRLFLVVGVRGDKVSAMRDDGQGASFAIDLVNRIYRNEYSVQGNDVDQAFYDVLEGKNKLIDPPDLRSGIAGSEAVKLIRSLMDRFVPADSPPSERKQSQAFLWESSRDAEFIERAERDIEFLKSETWLPFERRARVLHHFGYLDFFSQKVTDRGKWLADLRVDRPLFVGEAIRRGVFEDIGHKQAAGLMASLAADPDRNFGDLYLSDDLLEVMTSFVDIIYDVSNVEWKNGVEPAEEVNFSAAAAAERWTDGMDWPQLVDRTKAEEGDLVRLLSRTGEALLQVANLGASHPKAAGVARSTAEILLREPVR